MDEKNFWHINLKIPKVTVIFMFFFVIFSLSVLYFQEWPRPLVLDDPKFPEGTLIDYEETAMRDWYSGSQPSPPKVHVWRKQYLIGLGGCCEEFRTSEKIFASLEAWMNTQGWVRWEGGGSPCADMAETEFLERNTEYVPYVRRGTTNLNHSSSSVCIAVWPWTENVYSVLVVTAKE